MHRTHVGSTKTSIPNSPSAYTARSDILANVEKRRSGSTNAAPLWKDVSTTLLSYSRLSSPRVARTVNVNGWIWQTGWQPILPAMMSRGTPVFISQWLTVFLTMFYRKSDSSGWSGVVARTIWGGIRQSLQGTSTKDSLRSHWDDKGYFALGDLIMVAVQPFHHETAGLAWKKGEAFLMPALGGLWLRCHDLWNGL